MVGTDCLAPLPADEHNHRHIETLLNCIVSDDSASDRQTAQERHCARVDMATAILMMLSSRGLFDTFKYGKYE